MAEPHFGIPPVGVSPAVGTSGCPCVADLINYALGQTTGSDRQRIETHLHNSGCTQCRSWIDKAAGFRKESLPNDRAMSFVAPSLAVSRNAPPPPVPDPTPIPESAKWQRQAFSELERRLRLLEES